MPTYQLQIKQIVDYPRCRIYRQFVRFLMEDWNIRVSGGSGLFYFSVLCSYANYRSYQFRPVLRDGHCAGPVGLRHLQRQSGAGIRPGAGGLFPRRHRQSPCYLHGVGCPLGLSRATARKIYFPARKQSLMRFGLAVLCCGAIPPRTIWMCWSSFSRSRNPPRKRRASNWHNSGLKSVRSCP